MKVIKVNSKNIGVKRRKKTEEMAYQLRVLAAVIEGWNLSPRIHPSQPPVALMPLPDTGRHSHMNTQINAHT